MPPNLVPVLTDSCPFPTLSQLLTPLPCGQEGFWPPRAVIIVTGVAGEAALLFKIPAVHWADLRLSVPFGLD